MHYFSKQTGWKRTPTRLSVAYTERLAQGEAVFDLTCANPTRQGFVYPDEPFGSFWEQGQTYAPQALGLPEARGAVAAHICVQRGTVTAEQIWIGAGTSELYAQTMAILCEPGDGWLVPQPGYPLFDYVSDLAGVRLAHYLLQYDGSWFLDSKALETAVAESEARALVVISPHNPTGHVWTEQEREMVVACCKQHNMALVVDEVFLDFPVEMDESVASCAGCDEVLTICLSGASKVAAFPQGKIAWAAVSGPGSDEFLARAELVADTFLSTSTVMQAGLPALLRAAVPMQEQIRVHLRENVRLARHMLAGTPVSVCPVPAGWSMLLRLPDVLDDASWAMLALKQEGVLTHPGYLFGMETVNKNPFLGISLLVEPSVFRAGIEKLACVVAGE